MKMFFEIIFLSAGILLVVPAVVKILRNMRIKRDGIPVNATVVDIHRTRKAGKNKSRTYYHPVFEYRVDGRPVNTRGPGSVEVKYPVGTVLEIRYDPQRPERILAGESAAAGNIAPIWIGIAFIVGFVLSMTGIKLPKLGASAGYLVFAGMLLFLAIIIFVIVKSLRGAKNKFTQKVLSGQTASNVLVAAKNENGTITFQFVNGNRIDYTVPETAYNGLQEGDWGNLTFQGSLFIRFERTYSKH
jgi:hypothetical protein